MTIIARNEADRIGEALDSVAFADEVVVLDSGSTDQTVSVAKAAGARVIETDWPGHIRQKNRAIEHATHDWILSIDADERVSEGLADAVAEKVGQRGVMAYAVNRLSHWQGQPIRHGTWHPDWRIRLFHRDHAKWGGYDPHDKVLTDGPAKRLHGGVLFHHPYRTFHEHQETVERYAEVAAKALQQRGKRGHWWDLAVRPPAHLVKAYVLKGGFLDGRPGWVIAQQGARYVYLKWSHLRDE